MTVSDALLGSRFWYSASTEDLSRLLKAQTGSDDMLVRENGKVASGKFAADTNLVSFFLNGSNESVQQALNRAETFAAQHALGEDAKQSEARTAERTATALGVDIDKMAGKVALSFDGNLKADEKLVRLAKTAVVKLLASNEFQERARPDAMNRTPELSGAGLNALLNAALGLTAMLRDGRISEEAVLGVANGRFYDLARAQDVLKLSLAAARQVKEQFVDAQAVNKVVDALVKDLDGREGVDEIKDVAAEIIRLRSRVVEDIPVDEKPVSEQSVEAQIKNVREQLRAFRYDVDKATEVKMTERGESFRRWADNLFHSRTTHMTKADLDALKGLELRFGVLAERLLAARGTNLPGVTIASTEALATVATDVSHRTNDAIRYHFSKAWQKETDLADKVRKELGDLVKSGGSREISFKVGADLMAAFDFKVATAQARVGGRYQLNASVSVPAGGGQITVTYRNGGLATAGVDAKIGAGSVAAKAGAEISGGGGKSVSRVYPNLKEFIRDMTATNRLVLNRTFGNVVLSGLKAAVKGIGHGILSAATALGLRIHKSKFDNAAYAQKLREGKTFANVDMMLSSRKNAIVTQRREAVDRTFSGGAKASGKATGQLSVGAGFSAGSTRELKATSTVYTPLVDSLAYHSHAELVARFNSERRALTAGYSLDEGGQVVGENVPDDVANCFALVKLLRDGETPVATALGNLSLAHDKMEAIFGERISRARKDGSPELPALQERYARLQRLYVFGALILRARARHQDDPQVLRAAENLCSLVSVPAQKLPQKVFENVLLDGTRDPVALERKQTFSLTFDLNAFSGVDHSAFGEGLAFLPKEISDAVLDNSLENLGTMTGTHTKIAVDVTRAETEVEGNEVRPWKKAKSLQVSFALTGSMPARLIFLAIATAVAKAGGSDAEKARFLDQAWQTLKQGLGSLTRHAVRTGVGVGGDLLKQTVGGLLNPSGGSSAPDPLSLTGIKTESELDEKKRFTLSFGGDGRLEGLNVADEFTTSFGVKAGFGQGVGIGFEAGLSVSSKTIDAMTLKKPSFAGILGRVGDFVTARAVEPLKNFLAANAGGVDRLVNLMAASTKPDYGLMALRELMPEMEKDKYAEADFKAFLKMRQELPKLLEAIANDQGRTAAERLRAETLKANLEAALAKLSFLTPQQPRARRLELAREIFTAMSVAYMFAARPSATPQPVSGAPASDDVPEDLNLVAGPTIYKQTPFASTCFGMCLVNALASTDEGRAYLETRLPELEGAFLDDYPDPPPEASPVARRIYATLPPLEKLFVRIAHKDDPVYRDRFNTLQEGYPLPTGYPDKVAPKLFNLTAFAFLDDGAKDNLKAGEYTAEDAAAALRTALGQKGYAIVHGDGHYLAVKSFDANARTVTLVDSMTNTHTVRVSLDDLANRYSLFFLKFGE